MENTGNLPQCKRLTWTTVLSIYRCVPVNVTAEMFKTMISTSSGGGIPFMPLTEHAEQPAQPQYPPSVPTVPSESNAHPGRVDAYLHRQSMGLGITLIIVGILAVIFNGVGFAVSDQVAVVSHGFFCGAMVIIRAMYFNSSLR